MELSLGLKMVVKDEKGLTKRKREIIAGESGCMHDCNGMCVTGVKNRRIKRTRMLFVDIFSVYDWMKTCT